MRKRLTITKEWLQKLGVTNVTENGDIYVRGELRVPGVARTYHKFGKDKEYPIINIYDPDYFQEQKKRKCPACPGIRSLLVSRVAYAWHKNICPGEFDVDHRNDNPFCNHIDNLVLLTRKENLAKRLPRNQFTASWTDQEILDYRRQKKYYTQEIDRCRKELIETKNKLEGLEIELNVYREVSKDFTKYKTINRVKAKTEKEIDALKQKVSELQKERHYWCNCYKEFLKKSKGE